MERFNFTLDLSIYYILIGNKFVDMFTPQDDNLQDVLNLTVQLMSEHPASMVPAFDRKSGTR